MLGDEGVISIDIGLASDTSSTSTGVTSSFTPAFTNRGTRTITQRTSRFSRHATLHRKLAYAMRHEAHG